MLTTMLQFVLTEWNRPMRALEVDQEWPEIPELLPSENVKRFARVYPQSDKYTQKNPN